MEGIEPIIKEDSYSNGFSEQPEQIAQIFKAMVTPTGTDLYRPEPEMKNRVLRKYSSHTVYFLQVSFLDETSEQLWYDRATSNEEIYHRRRGARLNVGAFFYITHTWARHSNTSGRPCRRQEALVLDIHFTD